MYWGILKNNKNPPTLIELGKKKILRAHLSSRIWAPEGVLKLQFPADPIFVFFLPEKKKQILNLL